MKLSLKLSRDLKAPSGRLHVYDLGNRAFTFGRSPGATLTVIDPTNQVSGIHFEIRKSADSNGVVLTDLSSGGMSLNSPRNRLQKEQPTHLHDQFTVYLPVGSVEITIEDDLNAGIFSGDDASEIDIFGVNERKAREHSNARVNATGPLQLDEPDFKTQEEDVDSSSINTRLEGFSLDEYRPTPPIKEPQVPYEPVRHVEPDPVHGDDWLDDVDFDTDNIFEKEAVTGFDDLQPELPAPHFDDKLVGSNETDSLIAAKTEPSTQPPANAPVATEAPQTKVNEEDTKALEALFQGLAIDLGQMTPAERVEVAAKIGQGFHAMAEAIRIMLDTRRHVKRTLGVTGTQIEVGANPLKVAQDASGAVDGILRPLASGFLHGEAAINDSLESMQSHQMALVGGIRTAIKLSLKAFDPDDLEARFKKKGLAKALPTIRKAELWDRFVENYAEVADQVDTDIRTVIGNELDRLYRSE